MNDNPTELVRSSEIKGALVIHKLSQRLSVCHSDDDNYRIWSRYRKKFYMYLTSINDEVRLEKARKKLAQTIWDDHYDKYPL
nr:3422_t:CDS:2 [Entrophospora candida]